MIKAKAFCVSILMLAILAVVTYGQSAISSQKGGVQIQKSESGWFDPQHPPPVLYRDNELELLLIAHGEQSSISLKWGDKAAQSIKLPDYTRVNEIRRVEANRAIVLGMNNSALFGVIILDLAPLHISDEFWGYIPSISPDGRYIAFAKFFPTHPGADLVEYHYMLYDTAKSAAQNRPFGIDPTDTMNVGTTMYPVGIGNKPYDNYGREDHMAASGTFFWDPNSETVLFADHSHEVLSLVLVHIEAATDDFRVRKVDLPLAKICEKDPKTYCLVNLTKVEFSQAPGGGVAVVIKGVGQDGRLGSMNYKFRYEQFK
jgi:hypothetical protein